MPGVSLSEPLSSSLSVSSSSSSSSPLRGAVENEPVSDGTEKEGLANDANEEGADDENENGFEELVVLPLWPKEIPFVPTSVLLLESDSLSVTPLVSDFTVTEPPKEYRYVS